MCRSNKYIWSEQSANILAAVFTLSFIFYSFSTHSFSFFIFSYSCLFFLLDFNMFPYTFFYCFLYFYTRFYISLYFLYIFLHFFTSFYIYRYLWSSSLSSKLIMTNLNLLSYFFKNIIFNFGINSV